MADLTRSDAAERMKQSPEVSKRNIDRWSERADRMRVAAEKLPEGAKKLELLRSADQLDALRTRLADSVLQGTYTVFQTPRRR